MKNNNNGLTLTFRKKPELDKNQLNNETVKSIFKEINRISKKINKCRTEIDNCDSLDNLKNININPISDDLGLIEQNVIQTEVKVAREIKVLNHNYRDLEINYFNKKIELLDKEINKIENDSEQHIKDIAGGTLFSIASVFLGISLTSSIVTAVQKIDGKYVILFYLTCLLISIITIGVAAIFMRKFDKKSLVITLIILLISGLWGFVAYHTYVEDWSKYKENVEISTEDNNKIVENN